MRRGSAEDSRLSAKQCQSNSEIFSGGAKAQACDSRVLLTRGFFDVGG